jgi:hypothetical protein
MILLLISISKASYRPFKFILKQFSLLLPIQLVLLFFIHQTNNRYYSMYRMKPWRVHINNFKIFITFLFLCTDSKHYLKLKFYFINKSHLVSITKKVNNNTKNGIHWSSLMRMIGQNSRFIFSVYFFVIMDMPIICTKHNFRAQKLT